MDDYELVCNRLEVALARYEAALDSLQSVVRVLRALGGYMPHKDQLTIREAVAVLVDAGRPI